MNLDRVGARATTEASLDVSFGPCDDLLLLTKVVAVKPWGFADTTDGWHQVATCLAAGGFQTTAQACEVRLEQLATHLAMGDVEALRRSGTEAVLTWKIAMIQQVLRLREQEHERPEQEMNAVKANEETEQQGEEPDEEDEEHEVVTPRSSDKEFEEQVVVLSEQDEGIEVDDREDEVAATRAGDEAFEQQDSGLDQEDRVHEDAAEQLSDEETQMCQRETSNGGNDVLKRRKRTLTEAVLECAAHKPLADASMENVASLLKADVAIKLFYVDWAKTIGVADRFRFIQLLASSHTAAIMYCGMDGECRRYFVNEFLKDNTLFSSSKDFL
ncbi:unnamed protein product [Phytophthora lilii]|uniref:Unnamed protein product n=1 Tax=Phytophthora lilii TaxID=2077276 RepID=A0A9W6WUK3_9STRA|nr:unnamed protein product [Phytophthora lilii]